MAKDGPGLGVSFRVHQTGPSYSRYRIQIWKHTTKSSRVYSVSYHLMVTTRITIDRFVHACPDCGSTLCNAVLYSLDAARSESLDIDIISVPSATLYVWSE